MNWGRAVGLALGVMKTVDLAKESLNPYGIPPEWSKSALTMLLAGAGAAALEEDWRERVLLAGAAAGAASVVHEAYTVLTTTSDRNKQQVINTGARIAASARRRVEQP